VARRLGLVGYLAPAFEDPAHWMFKEAELPANVDVANSQLADAEARARMARVFSHGLDQPTGYVLPVQRWSAKALGQGWRSEHWKIRRGKLFLIPGDSPVGFRLPLDSLPHVPRMTILHRPRRSHRAARRSAGARGMDGGVRRFRVRPIRAGDTARARQARPHRDHVRGARRQGVRVHAARRRLEDYLELLAVVEEAVAASASQSTSKATNRRAIRASM